MKSDVFEQLRRMVHQDTNTKAAQDASRVAEGLRMLKADDELSYLAQLEHQLDDELADLRDSATKHNATFFRDRHQWDAIHEAVNRWLAEGRQHLALWSSGCGSGHEAYALAMTVHDAISQSDQTLNVSILATDICKRQLTKAEAGVYDEDEVASIPRVLLKRYFKRVGQGHGARYHVAPALRELVWFKMLDLASPPYLMCGAVDVLLCRNVMLDFSEDETAEAFCAFNRLIQFDGLLVLGHAELLPRTLESRYDRLGPRTYRKRL